MVVATPLLERESELAAMDAAIERALHGDGLCVVVEGAAGIGKTSLLRAARAGADGAGACVLTARGSELEQTLPYGIVRQLFERTLARATPADRDEALAGAAGLAAPLLGAPPAAPPAQADEDSAFAVMHGLYWLAANLAERRPLVLAVDDLHWADVASLRWIGYLARRIEALPLAVLATVRPVAAGAEPALADVLADPATLIVRPSPLTHAAAAIIIGQRVEPGSVDDLSAAAHQATAGNPLLLRELAGALAGESSAADVVAQVRRLAPGVVARRVRLELARLGAQAGALARAVAVVGEDALSTACAEQLAGLDGERAAHAAEMLGRAEVLRPEPPLRFVHPLIRAAVYDAIPAAERAVAHARAAALLHARNAPLHRVAAQLVLAAPAADAATVERLRDAARQALAAGAADSARSYLQRALEEPPPDGLRADVLVELAAAESLLGVPEAVERLTEALPLIADGARRAETRRELARALSWRAQEQRAIAEIEAAFADAPAGAGELRRTLEAEFLSAALRLPDMHAAALARLDEIELGDARDPGTLMLAALQAYGMALRGERRELAVALAERALARGLPTEEAPSWSLWGAVSALALADRAEIALGVVDQAIADARRRGAVYLFSGASMVRSSLLLTTGALADAEADARAAVEALPDRDAMVTPHAFGLLIELLVERDLLDEAAAMLTEAGADGAHPETFGAISLLLARTSLRLARGDARAAIADAEACGRAFDAVGFRNPTGALWRSQMALALRACGDDARALAEEELALARHWGAPRALGRALRVLGLVAGGERGLALLQESAAVLDDSPAQLERARTQVELGSALRRAGTRVEARAALRRGAELAQRCGALRLARQAHEELLAAGAKPRSTALSGVGSLTPSERRVAAMAAGAMGNREIAQALFVTLRTVEMHLSNAFRKLDITSRTQLAAALAP